MKKLLLSRLLFLLFLLPLHIFAQPAALPPLQDITGLWKGSLYNDTTYQYLPYEIAISDDKGKLSGYSYVLFDIDGKKETGIKKIRIKIKDGQVFIDDVELISNNYSAPPGKHVRLESVSNIVANDKTMQMNGKWNTNRTKQYLPLTGTLQLKRSIDYHPDTLFKKLVELKLDKNLSFVQDDMKRQAAIALNETQKMEIKSPIAVPAQAFAVDKPKEVAVILPDKKITPLVENKPAAIDIAPLEKLAIKTAVDLPLALAAPLPSKKTGLAIASNELIKKENKPLQQAIAFVKPAIILSPGADKKSTDLVIKDTAAIKTKSSNDLAKKPIVEKPKTIIPALADKKKELVVANNNTKKDNTQPVVEKPKIIIPAPVTKKTEPIAAVKPLIKKEILPPLAVDNKPLVIASPKAIVTPVLKNKTAEVATIKEPVKIESKPVVAVIIAPPLKKEIAVEEPAPKPIVAAANVAERKIKQVQSVFFESDSLVLTLYDNGEVDGDIVSVLMNGKIIFANQLLSTNANSKTIYVDKGMQDSVSLVMYAENLGSIPPNTGLLVIMDGEKRYEVRFSADLKTNAAILLRRRTKEN